ncbi:MAG: heavy metal translocating P-type ATPase, partial [Nitrospirae bacterium]|nr:heavy metal translocating P-type ATPase [Nitrospirota bacterium]
MNPDREKIFTIKGMDCADCAMKIEKAVSKIPGVKLAHISFATEKLKVVSETQLDEMQILDVIKRMGYSAQAEEPYRAITLNIEGMDCADEQEVIEKKMRALNGSKDFDIYLMTQQLKVSYDPALISVQDIIKSIAETGMKASLVRDKKEKGKSWWKEKRQMQLLIICGLLIVIAFLLERFGLSHDKAKVVYGFAILTGAYYPARMGLSALKTLTLN